MNTKKIAIIGGGVFAVLIIVLLGAFLAHKFIFNKIDVSTLSLEEKEKILASVIKNNSTTLLGGNNKDNSLASLAGDSSAESKLNSYLAYPEIQRDYKYRYSRVVYTNGDAIGSCKQFNSFYNQASVTESYEYFDNESSYYKNISYNNDNSLLDYYLSTSTPTSSETTEYKGGSYAIKWSYDYSNIEPMLREGEALSDDIVENEVSNDTTVSTQPTDSDLITMYFGENTDVVDSININGEVYYVIQYSYNTNCNESIYLPLYDAAFSNESNLNDTIFVQNVVNPITFEIIRNSNYLGSISDSNLLTSYSSTIVTSNQGFNEVSNNFVFDYSVEVRDYTYPTYSSNDEALNLISYLENNNFEILTLPYELTYAYSYIASQNLYASTNYLSDRNFYPEGTIGDEMYSLYNNTDNYTYSNLSLSYLIDEITYQTLNIDLYDKNADLTDVMGLNSVENEIVSSIKVIIDGNDIDATLYEYTPDNYIYSEESISSDVSIPVDNTEYTVRYLTVEYNDFKYLIFVSDKNINLESLTFVSLDTSDNIQLTSLSEQITDTYTNYLNGSSAEAL